MIYLILAIICSTLISIIMRYSDEKVSHTMGMFVVNYLVCAALSRAFMGNMKFFTTEPGMGFVVFLGVISGILFLASFVLFQKNISKNGVMMSSTFMKLGVLIPTVMAMVVFREQPKVTQVAGIVLAVAAILIIHFEKGEKSGKVFKTLLIVFLICSGFTDSMVNIYDKVGSSALKDHYLFFNFAMACVCALVLLLKGRQRIGKWEILFGILIGVPNYFSSRFLLLALHRVPAVVVYPVYSVATIVVISIASLLLFKEKISKQKAGAIVVILLALVLLNV